MLPKSCLYKLGSGQLIQQTRPLWSSFEKGGYVVYGRILHTFAFTQPLSNHVIWKLVINDDIVPTPRHTMFSLKEKGDVFDGQCQVTGVHEQTRRDTLLWQSNGQFNVPRWNEHLPSNEGYNRIRPHILDLQILISLTLKWVLTR